MECAKQDPLHWICHPPDAKQKLNLGDLYKAGVAVPEDGNSRVAGSGVAAAVPSPSPSSALLLRSCVDYGRKGLAFERKGPYVFRLYTPLEHEPRSLAIDVFFEEATAVAQIRFRNHFVAQLSVLMKFAGCRGKWQTMVHQRQLMPHPHFEAGSRSYFEIVPHAATCWSEVSEIRLVLQQPSSNWKRFYVEHLAVYGDQEPQADEPAYLTHLMQRTVEALRMEKKHERRASPAAIPFHIGTHGYEIDKLHKF